MASVPVRLYLAGVYQKVVVSQQDACMESQFENVKEVCIHIAHYCGICSTTKPLADMCTAVISAKVLSQQNLPVEELLKIDHKCLGATAERSGLNVLKTLRSSVRDRIKADCELAMSTIAAWMWNPCMPQDCFDLCCEVSMVLEEVINFCDDGNN